MPTQTENIVKMQLCVRKKVCQLFGGEGAGKHGCFRSKSASQLRVLTE